MMSRLKLGRREVLARGVIAGALAAIGLPGARSAAIAYDLVDLKVVDRETGRVLPVWRHDGRLFVAGEPGERYALRVVNRTPGRLLAVMSVDGVNILTGETAGWNQRGYVFDAYQAYDVTGWRKSDTEVAAFTFAPQSQSYASRTGRPQNVGVIGIAVFKEKVAPPPAEVSDALPSPAPPPFDAPSPMARAMPAPPPPAMAPIARPSAAPPPSGYSADMSAERQSSARAAPAQEDERLGTGHGAREWSRVDTVPFERATRAPQMQREIQYDTYAHLVAAGVIPPDIEGRPRPFPSSPSGGPYVPDPPGGG